MPHPVYRRRHQKAVLWNYLGVDPFGEDVVSDPIEIKVRWVDTISDAMDPEGKKVAITAQIVTDREIILGSRLWKGSLESWLGTGSQGELSQVLVATTYNEAPNVRNRAIRREIGLSRFRDTPEPVAHGESPPVHIPDCPPECLQGAMEGGASIVIESGEDLPVEMETTHLPNGFKEL